jgi:hypothetical protein
MIFLGLRGLLGTAKVAPMQPIHHSIMVNVFKYFTLQNYITKVKLILLMQGMK